MNNNCLTDQLDLTQSESSNNETSDETICYYSTGSQMAMSLNGANLFSITQTKLCL